MLDYNSKIIEFSLVFMEKNFIAGEFASNFLGVTKSCGEIINIELELNNSSNLFETLSGKAEYHFSSFNQFGLSIFYFKPEDNTPRGEIEYFIPWSNISVMRVIKQ